MTEAQQLYLTLRKARIDREYARIATQRLIETKKRIDEKYSVIVQENPFFLSDARA